MNIQELREEIKEGFNKIEKELVELRKIQTQQAVTRNDVALDGVNAKQELFAVRIA